MINRELIRLKVVQLLYAYYINGDRNIDSAEKELLFSLSKAYDMYHMLLWLIVQVTEIDDQRIEAAKEREALLNISDNIDLGLAGNKFVDQLAQNKQLQKFIEARGEDWGDWHLVVRKLHDAICASDIYREYKQQPSHTYDDDRRLWRKLYKEFVCNNDDIDAALEELSLYWNDDKYVVDSFVMKTIKRFDPQNGADQPLLPDYDSEEDRRFALKLFRSAIENSDDYRKLISDNARNWDFDRLAYMDVIIMQTALAEMINFPQIPLSVSFNEYLNIARLYSTPQSASYINGLLDYVVKKLRGEGVILKNT